MSDDTQAAAPRTTAPEPPPTPTDFDPFAPPPKTPKEPKQPRKPRQPREPRQSKEPKAPQAPRANGPKLPKQPKQPRTHSILGFAKNLDATPPAVPATPDGSAPAPAAPHAPGGQPAGPAGPYAGTHPYPHPYPGAVPPDWAYAAPPRPRNPWAPFVLVLGGLVTLPLVLGGVVALTRAFDADGPTYRLTVPKELLNGQYVLYRDESADQDARLAGHRSSLSYTGLHAKGGLYTAANGNRNQYLSIVAFQGSVEVPSATRQAFAKTLNADGHQSYLVRPRTINPLDGSDPLSCAVVRTTEPGQRPSDPIPVCVWADRSTIGIVYDNQNEAVPANSIQLDVYAEEVAQIRGECRVKQP